MNRLELIETLINFKQGQTKEFMTTFLNKNYNKVIVNESYVAAIGNIPIALVAHMDTVFEEYRGGAKELFYDQKKQVLWCPEGAGFDDKAGVAAIIEIVNKGLRPTVILTTDEECGGLGAVIAANNKKIAKGLKYLIQLDRRGHNDCVFYDCDNQKFTEYVESFGFEENWGTFSDISILAPAWSLAAVNLSIGYENEHTKQEILRLAWYEETLNRVIRMLESKPPHFKYVKAKFKWNYYNSFLNAVKCAKCGTLHFDDEMFVVKNKEGKNQLWCVDCISNTQLKWCSSCFQAMELSEGDTEVIEECEECKKKREEQNNVQRDTKAV